ncbi:hypothetical protein [Streptomyces profundus]|uniref:hypothetical protein n=1 Tax=Streptomyces profundus TaxID=2867410 RepID=UPI001D160B83|nr:hypothetical protein [Streptomyces sp. MA3_2.13]UED85370.1 hypothetical protein K4G22_15150 [Streptomyces sp. MA3_2.13]
MRLSFHAELMPMNGMVTQTAMATPAMAASSLRVLRHGVPRPLTGLGVGCAVVSFLITRPCDVPINGRIELSVPGVIIGSPHARSSPWSAGAGWPYRSRVLPFKNLRPTPEPQE